MEDNKKRKYMYIVGPLILLIALVGVTAVRPSITLKSGIKITGGTGMENSPLEISE